MQEMLSSLQQHLRSPISRRKAISVGGLGMLGLNAPRVMKALESKMAHPKARAKRVIFLFQFGGPSQLDTFDMKPEAPEEIRGPLKQISSNVPGMPVCELLPKTAKIMDKVTLVKSVHHTMNNHNSAAYYALSGHAPPADDQRLGDTLDLYPAYGSVVEKLAPLSDKYMPTHIAYPYRIADGSVTPAQHASFLWKQYDPYFFTNDPNAKNFQLPELSLPNGLSSERLASRREIMKLVDEQSRLLETSSLAQGIDAYYEKALAMLDSPRLRAAFDLSKEPEVVREAYGRTTYGQSCLLARRLAEAGAKFITVYFSKGIGGQSTKDGGWDTHGFNDTRMYKIIDKYHMPITEQTLPTFLNDMDQRGLLDETLVLWMGEFGRTPKINKNKSRDHWPKCYTVLMAGGGVKRGYAYGASDAHAAYPADKPVRPDDISATLFHLLGIHPHSEVHAADGRPLPISQGDPIHDIIA